MTQPLATMSYLAQPLDLVLGSPGMVRVLRVLIRHGGQLPMSRLVQDSRLSLPGTIKVLHHLEGLGVVKVAGGGRARLFQATVAHPVVGMLDVLFRSEAGYRERALNAVKRDGNSLALKALWLFGSVARFEDRLDSDIDLIMVTDLAEPAAHEAVAAQFRARLSEDPELSGLKPSVMALTMADLVALVNTRHPIWVTAEREAKVLVGPSPRDLASQIASPQAAK